MQLIDTPFAIKVSWGNSAAALPHCVTSYASLRNFVLFVGGTWKWTFAVSNKSSNANCPTLTLTNNSHVTHAYVQHSCQ